MSSGRPTTVHPNDRSKPLERYYSDPIKYRKQIEAARQARKTNPRAFLRDRLNQVKGRAKLKNIPFSLTVEWLDTQPWVCAVTGVPFVVTNKGKGPLTPSFDRIDPTQGYTPANTRLVACWYNQAKSNWPDDEIRKYICVAADYIRASKI